MLTKNMGYTHMVQAELEHANHLLKELLLRHCTSNGRLLSAVPGLTLFKHENPAAQLGNCFYSTSVSIIVQGRKASIIGSEEYHYGTLDCLVAVLDMPGLVRMSAATPEQPFLGVTLELDKPLIAQLAAALPREINKAAGYMRRGVVVSQVEQGVLEAFLRLVRLLNAPWKIPYLSPLIKQELFSCLLLGPHGEFLRSINTAGSQNNQIAKAITWLQENYKEQLAVENLARKVHMAPSTFHRHFRELTTLSPLQFQKRLRLHAAQRLMLSGEQDASHAAQTVGYESVSQFNREYKRMFGAPPLQNIRKVQQGLSYGDNI